jgi:hypothetical protein
MFETAQIMCVHYVRLVTNENRFTKQAVYHIMFVSGKAAHSVLNSNSVAIHLAAETGMLGQRGVQCE